MPSWKKVIISGSDATLNTVSASSGIQTSGDILPTTDNTLSLGSATNRFQLNGGTPVTVDGSGTANVVTRFQGNTTVEDSKIFSSDTQTRLEHSNSGNSIFIVSGSNGQLLDVTDEIGDEIFRVNNGSGVELFTVSGSGDVKVVNSLTVDTNTLHVDSSNNRVGIGTTSPDELLHVSGNAKVTNMYVLGDIIHNGDADTKMSFTNDDITFKAGDVLMLTINENGTQDRVVINGNGGNVDFRVEGDTDEYLLFTDASTDRVGIGTTTPSEKLDVSGNVNISGTYNINESVFAEIASGDFIVADRALVSNNAAGYTYLRAGGTQRIYIDNFTSTIDITGSLNVGNGTDINLVGGGNLETNGGNVNTSGGSINTSGGNINLGIGALNGTIPGSAVNVDTVTATVKNFVIDHPTPEKEGYKLRHSSLEGPEIGVYFRGKSTSNIIDLPDYWVDLVEEESITVNLTPVGSPCQHYIEDIKDNQVIIGCACGTPNYHFTVYGERKDVEKLVVEYKEEKYL